MYTFLKINYTSKSFQSFTQHNFDKNILGSIPSYQQLDYHVRRLTFFEI